MNILSSVLKKNSHSTVIKLICITGTTAVTIRHLAADSFAKSQSLNEKLVSVHLFSRHGARTPLYLVNGIEEAEYNSELLEPYVKAPYVLKDLNNRDFRSYMSHWDKLNFENKLKGGAGRGQLTTVGEKQLFELGRRVQKRYVEELKFLSPDYDPSVFYSRSSHFRRTINSAKCFLAGVFNKEHDEVQEVPFVINVDDLNTDYIFPNSINCSYYSEMHKFISKLDLFSKNKSYIKHLEDLNAKIPKCEKENFTTFTKFRDDMIARQIHNLPVPDHFENDFEKSHELASKELSALSNHSLKLSCGRFLHHIINNLNENLEKDIKNEKFHKFRYYSVHDTTLNALLNSFELIDENNEYWPPFAADIVIELWKELDESTNKEVHFVRLFYCNEPMTLSDGSLKCKLENFIEIMKRHEVSCLDHYNHLCNQTFVG